MTPLSPVALPLLQGLAVALVLGLLLALFVGVLLLARPGAAFAINQWLSRWIDTAPAFSALDRPRSLERYFYRHHRLLGALIVGGASYVLWRWAFVYERSDMIAVVGQRWVSAGLDWLPVALEAALVALHVVILVVGALIMFRPSLLKGVERAANRWQQPSANRLDAVVGNLDETFEGHPRVSGLILTISATWCLLALAPALSELLRR
jgi:signal transduction histidine kinase